MSAIEMRPRSNIQWTVPHKAMPLRSESGSDVMTGRIQGNRLKFRVTRGRKPKFVAVL